jgi:hypothetical protein
MGRVTLMQERTDLDYYEDNFNLRAEKVPERTRI